jgi:UDP:flavonoid glycosyltransferase YjiC (YdhE family)
MVRLGVAARLDIADFSARRCAAALEKLRSEPSVRAACAAAAAHFSQSTSAAQAAQHVAALA